VSVSSVVFFLSLSVAVKASFNRRPGETLRRLPLESGTSNVILVWARGLRGFSLCAESDPVALGSLIPDATSSGVPSVSAADSTDVVLMSGDEEV
jgi:hypothetical protein